jgi:hypothetical protein
MYPEPIFIIIGVAAAAAAVAYFFFKKKKDNEQEVTNVVSVEEEIGMKKFALIVGINHYSTPGMDLSGCVNDAQNVKKFLLDCCGFEEAGIKMLTDNQATKANILGHLEWLVSKGGEGIELFYYHSGHGTQVFDVSGDESDQLDEVIVPHDHDWNDPFLDDYLAAIFAKLPQGSFLSMICDTCHSGSMTKDLVRNIAMPKEMAQKMKGKDVKRNKFGVKQKAGSPQRHILMSGCSDDQTSSEAVIGGVRQGAMTYNFLGESHKPAKSWRETHANIVKNLKASGWSQVPVLSGSDDLQDRIVFGRQSGDIC